MSIKKATALLLCCLLAAALFTACNNLPTATQPPATAQDTPAQTGDASPEPTEPEAINLLPYTGEEVTFTGMWVDFSTPEDNLIDNAILNRIGNIKFDWDLTGWDDYYTKVNTTMAAGELYDITVCQVSDIVMTYGPTGVLLDFNAYADIMPNVQSMAARYPSFNYLVDEQNHRYALYCQKTSDWPNNAWTYNKTLFDKLQLKVPTTDTELLDALRAIKAAEGFSPYPAVYGLEGIINEISTMYGLDRSIAYDQQTKKWYYGPLENDNYKKTLQFVHTMWEEELMDREADTQSQDQAIAKMREGKWATAYYWQGFCESFLYSGGSTVDWVDESFITPKGPDGKNYTIFASGLYDGMPTWGVVCSAKTEHPELLAAYFDMCYGQEFSDIYNWGEEGLTYEVDSNGVKHFLPALKTTVNPDGEYTLMRGINYDSHLGILDIRSYVLKTSSASGIAANNMYIEALQAGELLPWIEQPKPALSEDENMQYSTIMTPINTYVSEMQSKFVMGQESFNNWDTYLETIRSMGIDTVLEILNSKQQIQLGERVYELAQP